MNEFKDIGVCSGLAFRKARDKAIFDLEQLALKTSKEIYREEVVVFIGYFI